jgi:hypothetical protein
MDLSKLIDLAVLMAAFWALLKWTVNRELKNIYATMNIQFDGINKALARSEKQNTEHAKTLTDHHARLSVLEDRGGGPARRKSDRCPASDCPHEMRSDSAD